MKKLLAVASLGIASVSVYAAVNVPKYDAEAGQKIVEANCAACHGLNGVSVVPSQPNLAGQSVQYLYKQMMDFRTDYRKNAIMRSQIAGLSQQDIANIAGYYSEQQAWPVGAYGNPENNHKATKLYLGGDKSRGVIPCAGCHGPEAKGNAYAAFPRLGGQHAEYIATQLKLFRAAGRDDDIASEDNKRVNDAAKPGDRGMMQEVASKLSDKDITMLSQYISAVH